MDSLLPINSLLLGRDRELLVGHRTSTILLSLNISFLLQSDTLVLLVSLVQYWVERTHFAVLLKFPYFWRKIPDFSKKKKKGRSKSHMALDILNAFR